MWVSAARSPPLRVDLPADLEVERSLLEPAQVDRGGVDAVFESPGRIDHVLPRRQIERRGPPFRVEDALPDGEPLRVLEDGVDVLLDELRLLDLVLLAVRALLLDLLLLLHELHDRDPARNRIPGVGIAHGGVHSQGRGTRIRTVVEDRLPNIDVVAAGRRGEDGGGFFRSSARRPGPRRTAC